MQDEEIEEWTTTKLATIGCTLLLGLLLAFYLAGRSGTASR